MWNHAGRSACLARRPGIGRVPVIMNAGAAANEPSRFPGILVDILEVFDQDILDHRHTKVRVGALDQMRRQFLQIVFLVVVQVERAVGVDRPESFVEQIDFRGDL